jgi:hypothetical protein
MLTDSPKVVPVTAFGRRFRSTTEARWAVFLTELGVSWEYEPETYDLGSLGWYLPDFWLPAQGWFLEVKPGRPSILDKDYDRAKALHLLTSRPVLVANGFGRPGADGYPNNEPGWIYDIWGPGNHNNAGAGGPGHHFAVCACGRLDLSFGGMGTRCVGTSGAHRIDWRRLGDAYDAATSFRPGEAG